MLRLHLSTSLYPFLTEKVTLNIHNMTYNTYKQKYSWYGALFSKKLKICGVSIFAVPLTVIFFEHVSIWNNLSYLMSTKNELYLGRIFCHYILRIMKNIFLRAYIFTMLNGWIVGGWILYFLYDSLSATY